MSEKTPQPDLSLPDEDITELGQSLDASRQAEAEERHLSKEELDDLEREIYDELNEKRQEIDQAHEKLTALSEEVKTLEQRIRYMMKETRVSAGVSSIPEGKVEVPQTPEVPKSETPKAARAVEMGQAVLEAAQPHNKSAEQSFATATPDTREHKRVSTGILHAGEVHDEIHKPSLTVEDRTQHQPPKKGWEAFEEDIAHLKDKVESKALPWLKDDVKPATPEAAQPGKVADGYYFEGKKVSVTRTIGAPDTETLTLEVVDDEGNVHTLREDQLEIWLDGVRKGADDFEKGSRVKKPGTEVALYRPTSKEVEVYKGPEKPEEAKSWFAKARAKYGVHFWNAKFMAAKDFVVDNTYGRLLNVGVNDSMDKDEQDKKRDRNQKLIILGAGVLGGLIVGSLVTAGIIEAQHAGEVANTPPTGPKGGHSGIPEKLKDVLNGKGAHSGSGEIVNTAPPVTTYEPYSNSTFNVPSGEGGLELFSKLNLDSNTWYAHQSELLHNFPNDFYQNPGEAVRIAHSGWLSPEAQKFIESLKN